MQNENQHVDVGPTRQGIEEAASLHGDPLLHPVLRQNGVDNVLAVEDKATHGGEASQDVAQRCAVTATDIGDQPRAGEVIALSNRCMPVVRIVRHHGVEDAGFVRVLPQIVEAAHAPGCLMGYAACHRDIQHAPSTP